MKTLFTTFALTLALCAAAGATAQTKNSVPASAADTVLLSETTDGDYLVRRFIVKRHNDADYSVRYQINVAKLSSALDGNNKELSDLNMFVESLMKDTLMNVKWIDITGYSSPDGPVKFNETLAKNRAVDFKTYVDQKYNFSKKFDVRISSVAEDWEMCRALVAHSSMPDKQAVLDIIDGKWTPDQKELALKKIPAAWSYLRKNILPSLRRVEMVINYGEGNVIEQRTMIPKPAPAPQPKAKPDCDPCPCVVIDESVSGIIIQTDEPAADFRKEARKAYREEKKEVKQIGRDVRKIERKLK